VADDVRMVDRGTEASSQRQPPARRFGLLGGIGPESTIAYYRLILETYRCRRPAGGAPPLLVNSIDVSRMLGLVEASDLADLTDYLVDEVGVLADAGVECGAIASNTPHVVFDAVQARVSIPLISIVEVTCDSARAQGFRRLGLIGTAYTMQGRFYPEVFARSGIELVTPDPAALAEVNGIYLSELLAGIVRPASRDRLVGIARQLRDHAGIEGLILGGTELMLILDEAADVGLPLLDTTRLHVAAIVDRMLAS
jgi:aspartate racemase